MIPKRQTAEALSPRQVRELLHVSREKMGRLLDVSAKTVERWEESDQLPSKSPHLERLSAMREIAKLGLMIYGPEGFSRFLQVPLAEFAGRSPLQLIANGEAGKVISALAADYEGSGF